MSQQVYEEVPEPVEGNVRHFDKLSDRNVQKPTALVLSS